MKNLLFISHRMPWPLDKGEKIRAWHMIEHLSKSCKVHLGVIVDEPADMAHVEQMRSVCADVGAFPVNRGVQRLRALLRSRPGRPLMPDCYFTPPLQQWVDEKLGATDFAAAIIYTVAMAPYLIGRAKCPLVLDAVDIDSEKWSEYSPTSSFPMRVIWKREARTLLAYEKRAAKACDETLFVSQAEAARFIELAPESAGHVGALENGVDLDRFSPAQTYPSPFTGPAPCLVFTGNMDYWPNADAVIWFANDVLPLLGETVPDAEFWIVGANPSPQVTALASLPGVHVTGRVDDVRPFVAHAAVVVCPLRIARGIQNKVLEGMAMGRPVVASPPAYEGVRAEAGTELLVADGAEAFVAAIKAVLAGEHPALGQAARAAMERGYAWPGVLAALDRVIKRVTTSA